MVVIRDYGGIPSPHCGPPLSIHQGDVIELMFADLHSSWWQVRVTRLVLVLFNICDPTKKNTGGQASAITQCLSAVSTLTRRCVSPLGSLQLAVSLPDK